MACTCLQALNIDSSTQSQLSHPVPNGPSVNENWAYLYQRLHQSLPIRHSLALAICAIIFSFDRAIIANFVIYKWHEDGWCRVSDSATAGKILAQLPFTFLAAPAPLLPLEDASFSGWGSRQTQCQRSMAHGNYPTRQLKWSYRTCFGGWKIPHKEPVVKVMKTKNIIKWCNS